MITQVILISTQKLYNMKKLLLFIFLTLGYYGFTQVKSDTEMKTYNNTYISPGIVGGVRAVNHNMLNRYILDSKIHKDSLELNRNSDVDLTTPDSYDLLIMDEESMRWVNISLEDFSQLLSDSTVQMWYRSYDTAKTIYHVLVDSSFLVKYGNTQFGHGEYLGTPLLGMFETDGDTSTAIFLVHDNEEWGSGIITQIADTVAHVGVGYDPTGDMKICVQLHATNGSQTTNLNVTPERILLEADTTRITGQIFAPDIEPEAGAKFYQMVGYGLDGRLFPRAAIDWYSDALDSNAKAPTVYSTWVRDTTKAVMYQSTLTDKVGIGTESPDAHLDIDADRGQYKGIKVTIADSIIQSGAANSGTDLTIAHTYEAFKFTASGAYTSGAIGVYLKRDAGVSNLTQALTKFIYTDNAGVPGTQITGISEAEAYGNIGTSYASSITQVGSAVLVSGTSYWIVIVRTAAAAGGNVYLDTKNTGTALYAYSTDGSSWTTADNVTGRFNIHYRAAPAIEVTNPHYYGIHTTSISEYGVLAESTYDAAVRGVSINAQGIVGVSTWGEGIQGNSTHNIGVYGISTNNTGVYGSSTAGYGLIGQGANGVLGQANSTGAGVVGTSVSGVGLAGASTSGYGVDSYSVSNAPYYGYRNSADTNNMEMIIKLERGSSGTAKSGIGSSIDWINENEVGIGVSVARIGAISQSVKDGDERGALIFQTKTLTTDLIEKMRLDSIGNLMIGTTTPSALLTVEGGGYFNAGVSANGVTTRDNFYLPTTSSTLGQLRINNIAVMHNYGTNNIFVGSEAGNFSLTGNNNTALGRRAGYQISSGGQNTYLGAYAGYTGATAEYNVFIGYNAGYASQAGFGNVIIGALAGQVSTNDGNTLIGMQSGTATTSGANNTSLGYQTGFSNLTGSGNVFIGYRSGYLLTGSKLFMVANDSIGQGFFNTRDGCLMFGDFDNNYVNIYNKVGIGTLTTPAANLYVVGDASITTSCTIGTFLKLTPTADPPGSATEGMIYADTDHHLYYYNGTSWVSMTD